MEDSINENKIIEMFQQEEGIVANMEIPMSEKIDLQAFLVSIKRKLLNRIRAYKNFRNRVKVEYKVKE